MRFVSFVSSSLKALFLLGFVSIFNISDAQNNITLRVMSANITSGNGQSYETAGIDIFQGLKPDIVAIQEFRYNSSSTSNNLRTLVDTAFGANFNFFCQTGFNIPNGIVSRYPILASGSWTDSLVSDRSYAWAQIDLPGTNDLYVVSVHLYSGGTAADRNTEAGEVKAQIQANFPTNAWVIVAGDFNTGSRGEACVATFKTFLSDSPIPDDGGNTPDQDTNEPRNHPYDYLLPSFSLTNQLVPSVVGSRTFPNGLVLDTAVYAPLSDIAPVAAGDSHVNGMQHMAVIKDFLIPTAGDTTNAPTIILQPQSQTNAVGSTANFFITANGTSPLSYQWRFNGTNIFGATTNPFSLTNVQLTDAGNYSVIVSNFVGSVTSSVAIFGVTNAPASILVPPASQTVGLGATVTFNVTAAGTPPLTYQWQFNSTNIFGATTNPFSFANVQLTNAGNYSVVVSNYAGSVTSVVATLTINSTPPGTAVILAGWDVNGLGSYGPSPFAPTTNAPNLTVGGLTRGSGVTVINTASTNSWGGNGFDAASESAAITAGDYATFSIAANAGYTVSFSSLSKYDYKRSNSGPPNGVLQFQVGAGAFVDVATFAYPSTSTASLPAVDLSGIAALQNISSNTVVTFRIVNYGASNSGGNWYIADGETGAPDLAIQGVINSATPPTNAPAIINGTMITGGQLQFSVTGTTGGNYAVQTSTNLIGGNWVSVLTNQAPFNFTDTNFVGLQKFYRVIAP